MISFFKSYLKAVWRSQSPKALTEIAVSTIVFWAVLGYVWYLHGFLWAIGAGFLLNMTALVPKRNVVDMDALIDELASK